MSIGKGMAQRTQWLFGIGYECYKWMQKTSVKSQLDKGGKFFRPSGPLSSDMWFVVFVWEL